MTYVVELTIDNCEIDEQIKLKNIETLKNTKCKKSEVCFDYALKEFSNESERRLWNCKDGFYLLKEFFNKIKIQSAKVGDIITYHDVNDLFTKPCAGNCLHFGIILETDGTIERTTIESKFGDGTVYKTKICDVMNFYGNAVLIWNKTKEN